MEAFFLERTLVNSGMIEYRKARWSKKEVKRLTELVTLTVSTWKEIADELGRPVWSVIKKSRALALHREVYRRWSRDEIDDLRELRGEERDWNEIARIMGRERRSVINKAHRLGLE